MIISEHNNTYLQLELLDQRTAKLRPSSSLSSMVVYYIDCGVWCWSIYNFFNKFFYQIHIYIYINHQIIIHINY